MGFLEDFYKNLDKEKRKALQNKGTTLGAEEKSSALSWRNDEIAPVREEKTTSKWDDDDIAPVKEEKRTWFDKGVFDDGYQFGDIFKGILGTSTDATTHIGAGVIGIGEKLTDAGAMLGTALNRGSMMQAANNEIMYNAISGKEESASKTLDRYNKAQGELEKETTEFVAKDLYNEEEIAKKIISDPVKKLTGIDSEEDSFFGEKTDALAQSAGQLGAQIAFSAIPGIGQVGGMALMGTTAFGSEAESAFNQGATFDEGMLSATISAGAEILTEKLGGISFGGKTVTDAIFGQMSSKMTSKLANVLISTGKITADALAEGGEELLSGYIGALGQQMTYMEDKEIEELFSNEDALESFIGGVVLGGIGGSAEAVTQGKGYVTGLNKSEQKVVDKLYNDATEGKNLTAKEKKDLYNNIVENMDKGDIDTDTIESVLGGDDYKAYKEIADLTDGMTKEFDELGNKTNPTLAEQYRYSSLMEKIKGSNEQKKAARTKLDETMSPFLKNSRLAESYNEVARKKEAFNADLSQYDEKQRVAVERAIKSGVLNNTNKSHALVNTLSKIEADKGIVFDYTNNKKLKEVGFAIEGKTVNGFEKNGTVTLNVQSAKSWQSTVGHEIAHVLEGTDAYGTLQETLFKYAESKGELETRRTALTELYNGIEADIDKELTADLVGDYLFSDKDFIRNLTGDMPTFKKIYNEIKYFCKVATGRELTEIEKVRQEFDKVWKEYSAKGTKAVDDGKVNLSVSEATDGNLVAVVDNDILKKIDTTSWDKTKKETAKKAASNALKQFKEGIVVNGITHKVNKTSRQEYTRSKYTEKLYNKAPDIFADKMRAADIADDIVVATTNWNRDGSLKHPRDDNFVDFDRGTTLIMSGDAKYKAEVVIGITKNGEAVLYDVVDMTPTTFEIKKAETSPTVTTQNAIDDTYEISAGDIVTENGKDVKTNFSLSKSVEETKDLVAVHNLQSNELIKTLEYGGLPMPSIAIIKAQQGHENYGDVSLIFPKETIDPKASSANKVYGGDAWTPVHPRIEYKANEKVAQKIKDKYYNLADKIGYDTVKPLYRYVSELEGALNSDGGETALLERLYDDPKMMQVYLEDSGKGKVENIVKEKRVEMSETDKERNQWFIDKLGEDIIREFKTPEGENVIEHRKAFVTEHKDEIVSAWESLCREVFHSTEEQIQNIMRDTTNGMYLRFIRDAEYYLQNGGVTIKTETDYDATEKAIKEKASNGYKEWIDNLFKGVEEKTGIYNGKDLFTGSGNRRSWDALHWENTLENVVKAMKAQDQTGADAVVPSSALFAVAHKKYGSVDEIKADSHRLGKVAEEEYKAMEAEYASRLAGIADSIKDTTDRNSFFAVDEAADLIVDAVRNYKTKPAMLRYMKQWNSRVTESTVDDIFSLVSDIANMPTGYFEAKPQRAVGLEEVGVFVIPNNADAKLKQELLNKGYNIAEYNPNVEGDRQRVVNQFEEYKFSISNVGQQPYSIGNYSTPLNETALAPTKETISNTETVETADNATVDDIAPMPTDKAPISQRFADGTRGDELLNESLDNYPMETIEQRTAENIRTLEAEIADNKELRKEAEANYSEKIADLQKRLNAKKNKDTKTANNLMQSISRHQRLKDDIEAKYTKRISDLEKRVEKLKDPKYNKAMYKQAKMQEHAKWAEDLIGDTSTWKDKKLGIQYEVNTERRNLRDIVRDENGNKDIARADAIYDATMGEYNRNQAALNRRDAEINKKYEALKVNRVESVYANMLGELRHNPDTTLTEKVVNEYYEKHKNKIDTEKVDKFIDYVRSDLDTFFEELNAKLREQGMKEIPYRKGYFPHKVEPKQNFIQKLLNWKTQDNEIPTSIAGLTEDFKPVKSWQSFDKQRHSDETDYDLLRLFQNYKQGALDWIYHIEDIQKRRAIENHIRFTHSDEGVQAKIKEVYANEEYDADEAQAEIEKYLVQKNNPLNNFVQDFMTHTNILTGKKNSLDRGTEQKTNRKIYTVMMNVQNRTSANMVLANVRSALTNFIPITQSWAQVSPLRSLQATKDTIANAIKDDGMIEKSAFLTNRLREADSLYKTNWDKILDKAGIMFEIVDNFSSQVIWRSKYNQNLAKGMSESEAIANADQFAENVMAGRSKGNMPTLFESKSPLAKAFTMFQLEVNNQYGYFFKDVPNDLKAEANHWKLNLAKGYTTAFIGAYVYNALLEQVAGSGAALDPIGIIEELLKDLGLFDDDEEKEPSEAFLNFTENVVKEIPFVGNLAGGGRIPISSAIPYSGDGLLGGLEAFGEDASKTINAVGKTINGDFDEADWSGLGNIGKEMMAPILNVGLPVGGGQIKKTYQGLKMFDINEDHPVAGSYTDSGNLRFPVEDTLGNRIQAGIFGQYASKNAREYFDNGYAPLKEKQIDEYMDVDMPIADYWKYREGLKGLKGNAEKADYINSLDITDRQKNVLMNNILDRKEDVDMSYYDNYNSFEEFDYAQKNPEKYAFFNENGISYDYYSSLDEDGKAACTWAYNNPEKYKVSKVVTDNVVEYRSYTSDLYDIRADKDANGDSISGSAKEKKIDYINNLDLEYGQKIILLKMQYKSDDTYNADIIDYLNNIDNLSYEDRIAIFTELGFTVKDGYVYWD